MGSIDPPVTKVAPPLITPLSAIPRRMFLIFVYHKTCQTKLSPDGAFLKWMQAQFMHAEDEIWAS